MMPKILFLIQLPPPVHGASVVNKGIQDSKLISENFCTRFINISPAKELADIGKLSLSKVLCVFRIILESIKAFLHFKPSLVYLTLSPHGAAFYKDGLLALIIKAFGGKIVFHMHGKGIRNETEKSWLKKKLYRFVFKHVDIIHLAESLFYDIEGVRDKSRSITAIANGIAPLDESGTVSKDEKMTFVYLSNLVRSKGAEILIRAAGMIPEEYQGRFQVKIIGKPSDTQYLAGIEQILAKNPYKNINLLGPKYGQEKTRELTSSHVFVLPTRFKNECFPLSILEAMAAGLAVISTNEGAISEIIDPGITGDIIKDCTPEELAKAMTKHIEDSIYSASCGKASKIKFDANYTEKIFEETLASTLEKLAK